MTLEKCKAPPQRQLRTGQIAAVEACDDLKVTRPSQDDKADALDDRPGAVCARVLHRGLAIAAEARRADFWGVAGQAGRLAGADPDTSGRAATWAVLLLLCRAGDRSRAARMGRFLHEVAR